MAARILVLALAAALACSPAPRPEVDDARLARARAAADALGKDLMSLLTRELERGGPDAAIAVCADSAQVRTARHAGEGVHVRRVGTRVRNPGNTPDPVERAVLDAFARAVAAGHTPGDTAFTATGPDGPGELRLLRPIRVMPPCLQCHGAPADFSPAVREVLAERYPEDRAVGYQVGDLRGAVSVRVRAGR